MPCAKVATSACVDRLSDMSAVPATDPTMLLAIESARSSGIPCRTNSLAIALRATMASASACE
jgi:hypothetical protein